MSCFNQRALKHPRWFFFPLTILLSSLLSCNTFRPSHHIVQIFNAVNKHAIVSSLSFSVPLQRTLTPIVPYGEMFLYNNPESTVVGRHTVHSHLWMHWYQCNIGFQHCAYVFGKTYYSSWYQATPPGICPALNIITKANVSNRPVTYTSFLNLE